MALDQNYYKLWFESFRIDSTSGRRDPIQLHLIPGQDLPMKILDECNNRSVDPYSLLTARSKKLFYDYPVGTKFLLKSKLTDQEEEGLYFYTYYGWSPLKIIEP
jgi:hypothetical protein